MDVTEEVENTTQQLPINSTNTGNDDFQNDTSTSTVPFQPSESADLVECDHGNESAGIQNELF